LHDGRAIIVSVENPSGIFETGEPPRVATELDELDLGGHGIRALSYVPSLGEYVVIGGPASHPTAHFDLWRWSGVRGEPARLVTVPGLPGLERAEGICPAVIDGVDRIVIVCDDGNRKAGRFASFLLLDPAQLQSAH